MPHPQGRTTSRSRQRRRRATDAAHPLRVLSARRAAGANASGGTIFSLAREKMVEKRVPGDAK